MNTLTKFAEYKKQVEIKGNKNIKLRYNLNDKNIDICDRIGILEELSGIYIYIYTIIINHYVFGTIMKL